MRRELLWGAAALCAACQVVGLHAEEEKTPGPPRKATAEQLIHEAQRAIAYIGKTLRESHDKTLDPKNARQQPFWAALKKTDETTTRLKTKLEAHDPKFFDTLNDGTQAASELKSAYPHSGIKNLNIEEGVRAAANALTLLRRNYGRETLRKKAGTGELNTKEKNEFTQLKVEQRKLAETLEALQEELKDDKHLSTELKRLIAQLDKSIDAPMTVDAYDKAHELTDVIEGEWGAYSYLVEPRHRKAWADSGVGNSLRALDGKDVAPETDDDPDWDALAERKDVPEDTNVKAELDTKEVEENQRYVQEMEAIDLQAYYESVMNGEGDEDEMEDSPEDVEPED